MDQRLDQLLQRCTVKLKVPDKVGWGSGFFIASGLILTCAHVVEGVKPGGKVQVSSQEQISFPDTTLVQSIPDYDLALLRFSPSPTVNLPCVYLAPDFEPFDRFYTFGYSDQFPDGASVTSECEGTAFEQGKELILFKSGQIRPGISGSALLNWATGRVCGIVKFTRDRTTDLGGGAIPTQVILEQFPQIKELQQQFHQQDDRWVKSLKVPTEETWREVCRNWIKVRRSPVTDLFADILGKPLDLDEIHVPLGLLERQRKPIAPKDVSPETGSQAYRPEQIDLSQEASVNRRIPANQRERQETITPISYDDFFRRVLAQRQSPKSQGKRLAIIGEAGAGKTVQLLKIADWVLNATEDLPIWISLGALGEQSLREYVFDTWLPAATARLKQYSSQWENDLEQRLKNGKIWLLLDGLDEMGGANPLGRLTQELREDRLLAQARVVLTCRVNLWDAAGSAPSEFDTYKMLDFSYGEGHQPDQVKQFIEKWFTAIDHLEWGDSLRMALDEPGKERIKDLARNPLRLGLLCFTWQEKQGNLPETKAMLYQQFVESLYLISEKTKGIELTPKQQSILNKALGRLAKQAIDRGFKSILPHNLVYQELVESQPVNLGFDVFDLALRLSWINRVGMEAENPLHNVYAFFHPSFQEYFAALAIDDWDFFLPRNHRNQPVPGKQYRVFEPQWREVILLWLGRSDVEKEKKEQLIRSLVEFKDISGNYFFYGIRAYCLAAKGITEFKGCSRTKEIIKQIVEWNCGMEKGRRSIWLKTFQTKDKAILSEMPRADVIATLRELIANTNSTVRERAVEALGSIGSKEEIPPLIKALEDPDDGVRRSAALALGKIDSETAIPLLNQVLKNSNEQVRRWAVCALGEMRSEAVISSLTQTLKDPDKWVRMMVVYALGEMGSEAAIPPLKQALKDPDEFVRLSAVEALGHTGLQTAIPPLIEVLKDSESSFRNRATESLGRISSEAVIPPLIEALKDPDEFVRMKAAYALGEIGLEVALLPLIHALEDAYEPVRNSASEALGKIGSKAAIPHLIQALEHSKEWVRWSAAGALGDIGSETAIPPLIKALQDSNDVVCGNVALALGEIGSKAAIPHLIQALEHASYLVRGCAAEALGKIGSEVAIPHLIQTLKHSDELFVQMKAAESLGKLGSEAAIPHLIQALEHHKDQVRDLAVKTLREILVYPQQMKIVITALKDKNGSEWNYQVLGHCAKTLSYPEFYEAWQHLWPKSLIINLSRKISAALGI